MGNHNGIEIPPQRGGDCEDEDRHWRDEATGESMPDCWQEQKPREVRKDFSLEPSDSSLDFLDFLLLITLISGFLLPELGEDKFLSFEATQFVALCYSIPMFTF